MVTTRNNNILQKRLFENAVDLRDRLYVVYMLPRSDGQPKSDFVHIRLESDLDENAVQVQTKIHSESDGPCRWSWV